MGCQTEGLKEAAEGEKARSRVGWGAAAPRVQWAPRIPVGTIVKSPALFEAPTAFLVWGPKVGHPLLP